MFQLRSLIILRISLFSLVVNAQPMASIDMESLAFEITDETDKYIASINPRVGANIESRVSMASTAGDSLELIELEMIASHEFYLDRMMSDPSAFDAIVKGPMFYDYMHSYLQKLEKDFGNEPFFFESYYHPEVQYLTGCNMGKAGMPILEKIQFEDGRVQANLICRTEHADIYYTLDGSQPTKSSLRFTEIFEIPEHTTVRAISIRDDLELSSMLVFDQHNLKKEEVTEQFDVDKIMGIYPIPNSDEVLVKYKTKAPGEIAITLIGMDRTAHHIDFVQVSEPQMGRCHIDASRVPVGSYLIKFKFESGKTTYRQVVKE